MKRKSVTTQHLVGLYTKDHLTLRQIAGRTGMTHAGVWKRLRRAGITARQGEHVELECAFCGAKIDRLRSDYRKTQRLYCKAACYYADLENPGYKPWRQGQRLARAIVSQHFQIPAGAVIHHKDGDNRNNDLSNLAVYEGQADHLGTHRGHPQAAAPIWDGVVKE